MQLPVKGLNTEPQFLIDTAAINAKYAKTAGDPRRWWTGTFQTPFDCVYRSDAFEKLARERCGRFINAMHKKGWDLVSRLSVYGPQRAHDIDSNIVLLDKREYRVRGVFQLASTPKPVRLEIPPDLVRREPEQTISLSDATAAFRQL